MGVPASLSSVPDVSPYIQYVATSGQTVYPYPFPITQDADLVVVINGVAQATDSTYVVSGVGNSTGGNVTLNWPGSNAGDIVTLYRDIQIERISQIAQNSGYSSQLFNNEFNNFYLIAQQLQADVTRCLQVPNTNNPAPVTTLTPAQYANKYLAFDANGNPTPAVLTSSGAITAPIIGSVLYPQTSVETTVFLTTGGRVANAYYPAGHAWRYGADPLGAVNATVALRTMYLVAIGDGVSTGCDGYVPPGVYKVTPGVLVFNNNFTNMAWPNIYTGGYRQTEYLVDGANQANAPMLTLNNGTATSTSGNFWYGGCHGGITISDTTGATATGRHGVSLTGVWGTKFGYIRGSTLTADVVNIPANLYGGGDPDPYAVNLCEFEGIESFFCVGWALDNLNYVGFNGNLVHNMFVAQGGGGWFGLGSQNVLVNASMEAINGYCFDDGCFAADTGGAASKFTLINGELDNCKYCWRFNVCLTMNIQACRIIHRYQVSPNASAVYWPLTAVQFAAGTTPNVQQVNMQLTHRLEAGGTHGNIGTWTDFANAGGVISGVTVENALDNETSGAITIVDTDYFSNFNTNSLATVTVLGRRVIDTQVKVFAAAYGDGTTAVLNSGYGTTGAKVLFPVEQYDADNLYATSQFTAPWTGQYEFRVRLRLTMASGSSLRLGILDTNGPTALADSTFYAASNTTQTYELSGVVSLTAGDVIYPMAAQSTATGSITCDAGLSQKASNIFQVRAL